MQSSSTMPAKVVGSATLGLAMLLLIAALASPAQALTQVRCLGSSNVSYSPPISDTPQTTTATGITVFAPCVSLTDPDVSSGAIPSATVTRTFSCLALLAGGPGAQPIVWNTGDTSVFSFTSMTQVVRGELVVVQTGNISAGRFRGATAALTTTWLGNLTTCGTTGFPGGAGPTTLTIVRLL
jgi:hypothetical protein